MSGSKTKEQELVENVFLAPDEDGAGAGWYGPDYPDNEVTPDIAERITHPAAWGEETPGAFDKPIPGYDPVARQAEVDAFEAQNADVMKAAKAADAKAAKAAPQTAEVEA